MASSSTTTTASSFSSSSSSYDDSLYFSAPSPCTREDTHGEEDVGIESSSSATAAEAASSSSSSSSSASSSSSSASSSSSQAYFSLDPSSSTRENTHHDRFISFREEDIRMKSLPSSSSCPSSSQPSSSNASPSTGENIHHDLFISFRGEDTRQGFVSHLHSALRRNDIRSYMDDSDLERGNEISSALLRAIEQSKISLIVFSENYASSRWTLDELVKIMNCRETGGQLVLPIFYRISPSEVGNKRSYSAVFKKHKNLFWSSMKETEQQWTNSMAKAAKLAGWDSSKYRTESELVEVIVIEVKRKLESMSHGSEGLVSSSQNCSPEEFPNSGGSSHDDDPTPQDSSPTKCLSYGTLNLLGYLGDRAWDVLRRKEHESLILKTKRPDQPSSLGTSRSYVYRNRYVPKQEHIWWGTQHKHLQQ